MPWELKSKSDTDRVYAHTLRGKETGRYRYVFTDERPNVEVGRHGLHGRRRSTTDPRRKWVALAIAAPTALVVAEATRLLVG